jgi:hypothetical protein
MFIYTHTCIHNTLTVSQYLESSLFNCVFWFSGQIITSRRAAGCKIILHVVPTTAKWFSGRLMHIYPVAKFIVSDWGDKVDSGRGLSYRPARLHIGWQAGKTPLCRSQLYPPVSDYEFGYSIDGHTVRLMLPSYMWQNFSGLYCTAP